MGRPNILNYQLCRAGTKMAEHNWGIMGEGAGLGLISIEQGNAILWRII